MYEPTKTVFPTRKENTIRKTLKERSIHVHINSPYLYNLHKLATILVKEEDGKVMDYLAQR